MFVVKYSRRALLKLAVGVLLTAGLGEAFITRGTRLSEGKGNSLDRFKEPQPSPVTGLSPVAIVRGNDPADMVRKAVTLAGGLASVVRPGATVLLKPNLTIPSPSGRGDVTDSRVLAAAIDLCRQAGAGKIIVGDGSGGGDSAEIMRGAGYEPILKAAGITFVDFNTDQVVVRKLADADGLHEYSLAKTAAEADVVISLAVLKVHRSAIVTLSCKNLIGITSRSVYGRPRQHLHDADVQRVIPDLVRLRRPDFAVVDGTVGLEGDSPLNGSPVPMDLIIAGRNPVSVDAVGAAVMGFDPRQIEQLVLMAKRGLGEIDPAKIAVVGSSIAEVQRKFRR